MIAPTAPPPTSTATPVDAEQAYATLVVAFSADPVVRWLLPDTGRFLRHFPDLLRLVGDPGTVDHAADGTAAAIWHAPGSSYDEQAVGALLQATVDPRRHEEVFAFYAQMEDHHPDGALWYLPFIGVDPTRHGRGHGSSLLRRGLDRCDRDGVPAYLEASSPRNRALYERHGFEAFAEIRVADSPPLWPMLRPRR